MKGNRGYRALLSLGELRVEEGFPGAGRTLGFKKEPGAALGLGEELL